MKKIIEIFLIIIVILFGTAFSLISNRIGGWRGFTVMSGSMEPSITTGSMVIVKNVNPQLLKKGDVITFKRPSKENEFITHRILALSNKKDLSILKTKGDHNKEIDPWVLAGGGVVGKVIYSIPYLGYLLVFAKTKIGITFFILIPAFIIIYLEVINIFNLLKNRKNNVSYASQTQSLTILLFISLLSYSAFQPANALLSDSASLTANKFTVALQEHPAQCGDDSNIEISGNGAGSNNAVSVNSNCSTIINESNNTTITNAVNSNSSTGNNQVINNTGSNSTITTGNVNSNISIQNK